MSLISVRSADLVGTISLEHPEKRNALSEAMVGEIVAALGELKAAQIRVAILRAAPGARVWSAGHDVGELPTGRRDPLGWDGPLRHLIREIEQFPAPVIAMIEGSVWGGACETVFACDLIVAAPTASFAATMIKDGRPAAAAAANDESIPEDIRFSAKSLAAHRKRLGLSAADLGLLMGASTQSIYNWESGKARPHARFLPTIVGLRSVGKKQTLAHLEAVRNAA